VEQIMGLPVSIHVRGSTSQRERERAVAAAFASLRSADATFSTYRPDSEISQVRSGQRDVEECTPVVAEVLELCERASEATNGYFSAWLPDAFGVLRLDPSGLVKGWAAQEAAAQLDALTDDHYLNAGGDLALTVRSGQPWRIAVEDPRQPEHRLAVLALSGGGLATSGTARRGAHILDPMTSRPATALLSASVVGPSLLWADVFATAACARGIDALTWLRWPPGYEAMAVTADGHVLSTPGFDALRIG
jgi:thiamine biosynthesis lipoprotein